MGAEGQLINGEGGNMNIGQAIEAMENGKWVRRPSWNGKKMHLYIEDHLSFRIKVGAGHGTIRRYAPCIVMFTAQGVHQPGWLASQSDLLARDWEVVPDEEMK